MSGSSSPSSGGRHEPRSIWVSIDFLDSSGRLIATHRFTPSGDRSSLEIVEALARLQLAMRRLGGYIHVIDMDPELRALIDRTDLLPVLTGALLDRPGLRPDHRLAADAVDDESE
jgi:hypothetical protein